MSLEKFARERLMRELPGFRKNGLNYWLKHIDKTQGFDGIVRTGFTPDGTRFRKNLRDFDPDDPAQCFTLELWEIEDTWKITENKMDRIQRLAHTLFDSVWIFTEVWVCNRYGTGREMIYDVRTEICGFEDSPSEPPYEWLQDGEWISEVRQPQPAH